MDLTEFPAYLNDALFGGDNLVAAQMLLTIGVMLTILLPAFLTRQRGQTIIYLGLFGAMFATSIGWVGYELMIVILFVSAALIATKAGDWIQG